MTRRLLVPLLASAAIVSSGCGDDPSNRPDDCTSEDDCTGGAICVDGACVAPDASDVGDAADAPGDGSGDATDATDDGSGDAGDTGDVISDVADEAEVEDLPLAFVVDPADGATFVPLDVTITVRFNQPMNELRFIPSNITLQTTHGERLDRVLGYDGETYTLSVAPPEENGLLRPVTPYEFRLEEVISAADGETIGEPYRVEFSTTGYPGRVFLRQLAEAYAPVVYQQVETPKLDTFARIDFDGNVTPSDNLDHATGANYGYVYFDVIETPTHFFLTYMFYYPGSVPRTGVEYEHDIMSLQVVVQKVAGDPLGRLRAFSTFYHENLNVWAVESSWYPSGEAPSGNDESIDGRLRTADLVDGRHVSIFVESGRHAVCLPTVSTLAGPCAPDTDAETAPFDPATVGLVYRVAEAGQRMGDAPNDALTYSLRSFVEDFWALRARTDGDEPVFGGEFEYHPPVVDEGTGTTRPGAGEYFPTALDAENDDGHWGDLPFVVNTSRDRTDQGVWFVDPAWSNNNMYSFPESFSPNYCFNPYLNIDVRDELAGCTPTDFTLDAE